MFKYIHTASRVLLGLIYFIFGGMGLLIALKVMPMEVPPMTEGAEAFFKGITASGYFFPLLKCTEVLGGLVLLIGGAAPLALVVLAPITIHIFLFHAFLTPGAGNLVLPGIMILLQVIAMLGYLKQYRSLFLKIKKRERAVAVRKLVFLWVFLMLPGLAGAAETHTIDPALFGGYDTALVVLNRGTGQIIRSDAALADRKVPPCSTFKIYNTLIGLEVGLIRDPDAPWYTWDGIQRSIPAWNRNLTAREAFAASAVPAYQALARQIGARRMKKFIRSIGYGTRDISSGIDVFWLDPSGKTPIKISANEQVELFGRLLDGKLPFAAPHIQILKDIMRQSATEKGALYGKTGTDFDADGKGELGWFVGFVQSGKTEYVFACNITGGDAPTGLKARKIVEDYFRSISLL